MKLIEPSYEILTPIDTQEFYKTIERAARTCYKSEDKISEGSAEKLVNRLVASGHHAMIEFAPDITVKFIADRAFTHEMVRHRHCSFAQESQRYVKYENNDMEFIKPLWFTDSFTDIYRCDCFTVACEQAEVNYGRLRDLGLAPQEARAVLPNAVKTEICVSANVREWRHIFELRTAKSAHPEMRRLMCPLLNELKTKLPILFNDITY